MYSGCSLMRYTVWSAALQCSVFSGAFVMSNLTLQETEKQTCLLAMGKESIVYFSKFTCI